MFINNRVLWSEGMLLTPQHFQQQERYIDYLLQTKVKHCQSYCWGFQFIRFSEEWLRMGKLKLLSCMAIFPSGVVYNAPDVDLLPEPFEIHREMNNCVIYLTVWNKRNFPYMTFNQNIVDVTDEEKKEPVNVSMGRLTVSLSAEAAGKQNENVLSIAKIEFVDIQENVSLCSNFIPPCLNYRVSNVLDDNLEKTQILLKKLLHHYIRQEKCNVEYERRHMKTYILMQILNHFYHYLMLLKSESIVHPYSLYRAIIYVLSELSLYNMDESNLFKRYTYQHDQLGQIFDAIFETLFSFLNKIKQVKTDRTNMKLKNKCLWVSEKDIPVFSDLDRLILSIYSNKLLKTSIKDHIRYIKVAPLNKIQHLICHALPSFSVTVLEKIPNELMDEIDGVYLLLKDSNKMHSMTEPIACHFDMPISDVELSLWCIRQ
jgi:type VI secretion system protein ImpJ